MDVGYFYYSNKNLCKKEDPIRDEESPRHQDHYPKETTSKLERVNGVKRI
jgi:hypothetical protein